MIDKKEPTPFDLWIEEKIKHTQVSDTLLLVDDTFGSVSNIPYLKKGKKVQPNRRYIDDIPDYENFVHLLVSECFYASERRKENYFEKRKHLQDVSADIDGQGKNIQDSINEIRSFIYRNDLLTGKTFKRTAQKLNSEFGITINSCGKDLSLKNTKADYIGSIINSHYAIDKILLCFLDELKNIKNHHFTSYIIEGVFFPKKIKRMLANPHMDILYFRLAILIKDWKLGGKYISSQVSENKPIDLPPGNFFSEIIASLVNSFLSPSPGVEPKEVSERLKELKKYKVHLLPPSMDFNF